MTIAAELDVPMNIKSKKETFSQFPDGKSDKYCNFARLLSCCVQQPLPYSATLVQDCNAKYTYQANFRAEKKVKTATTIVMIYCIQTNPLPILENFFQNP